jgi:3-phenylpropionate/trans-cinnamate dioxygenase ferredoxin reductase subunit
VAARAETETARVSIVIVGASVAGVRTVQALRMQGLQGVVTLIGEEPHHPYDKPPLSKQMLAQDGGAPVPLVTAEELTALDVDLRLGLRATGLDPAARLVQTSDGRLVRYAQLVIATGVRPRTLPGASLPGGRLPAGVRTIRTADDALALRAALAGRPDVVVVGAGFIGAEFASAARRYGCAVSMVEAQAVPMAHILGAEVGALLAKLHESNGVELYSGVTVGHFQAAADGHVSAVRLADGRALPAGLVVVGIGAQPATEWLASSGLPVFDGVDCDAQLRVIGYPGIFAAGDVARWPHPLYGFPARIEHWTNANEHAATVAASILRRPAPAAPPPYVWSDQYGHRIQIVGWPRLGTLASLSGGAEDHLTALYADGSGVVVGGLVLDDPRTLLKVRKAIAKRSQVSEVCRVLTTPVLANRSTIL